MIWIILKATHTKAKRRSYSFQLRGRHSGHINQERNWRWQTKRNNKSTTTATGSAPDFVQPTRRRGRTAAERRCERKNARYYGGGSRWSSKCSRRLHLSPTDAFIGGGVLHQTRQLSPLPYDGFLHSFVLKCAHALLERSFFFSFFCSTALLAQLTSQLSSCCYYSDTEGFIFGGGGLARSFPQ